MRKSILIGCAIMALVGTSGALAGPPRAKAELHEVSKEMTPAEIAQAQAMTQSCEAPDYRQCAY
jgi:gas vesicle protein